MTERPDLKGEVNRPKILLLGKNGQLGWELQRTLSPLANLIALGRADLDVLNFEALAQTIATLSPHWIVNAVAYTAVDQAESEPELAMAVNGKAPGILAAAAGRCGASLVHYSTDYVFNGQKNSPYTEMDDPDPLSVYGQTKLAGEQAIQQGATPYLILRTSWIYGIRGKNFLRTLLRLLADRQELKIVDDQRGAPTWSRMVAEATAQIIAQYPRQADFSASRSIADDQGVYHLTAQGETSWYGFAKAIADASTQAKLSNNRAIPPQVARLLPIPSREYPTPAPRPAYSVLDHHKASTVFGIKLPDWRQQLDMALQT